MVAELKSCDVHRFPCMPWAVQGTFGERMQPIPGTWTLAPESLCAAGVKGVICCPNRACFECALIPFDMGTLEQGVLHLQAFSCRKCGFLCNARLLEWDTRKLFCIAYELLHKTDPTKVRARKEYVHAENRGQAISYFVAGTGYLLDHASQDWRLVEAGVAIGYFGQLSDPDQKILTTD